MEDIRNMTAPWDADRLVISSLYTVEQNHFADALVDALELHKNSTVFQIGIGDELITLKIGLRLRELGGEGVLFAGEFAGRQMDEFAKKVASTHLMHQIHNVQLSWKKTVHLPVEIASIERFLAINFFQYLEADSPYYDELERVLKSSGCGLLVDWHDNSVPGYSFHESERRLERMKGALEHEGMHYRERTDISDADWVLEIW